MKTMIVDKRGMALPVYVIYKNPTDCPGKFVCRRWMGMMPDQKPLAVSRRLDKCRRAIPAGFTMIERMKGDDPAILELWI